jgi:hypothetical protein
VGVPVEQMAPFPRKAGGCFVGSKRLADEIPIPKLTAIGRKSWKCIREHTRHQSLDADGIVA